MNPKIPPEDWSLIGEITFENVRSHVLMHLLAKDKPSATELMVKWIMKNNYIHTTRDDENAEMWIYKEGIYVPEAKTFIIEEIRHVVGDAFSTHLANQVIMKIQADTFIEQDVFFEQENVNLIPVENGILNLKTRELIDFNPKYRFLNKIPIYYNPKSKCKNIKLFLSDVLSRPEDIKIIQELFGYLLYDNHFIEKGVIFYGSGRNGKSKTISLMKTFIGAENCTEIPLEDLERDMFSLGELFKKKANLCGDLNKTAVKNSGNFKKLVGRDLITAPRKFKTRVKFVNTAKMIFCANVLPLTYDVTPAFFNRWVIIDFPYQFLTEEEIKQFKKKVPDHVKLRNTHIIDKLITRKELSGLLNFALDGLKRLFNKETFTNTETTDTIKDRWMMRSSSIMSFCLKHIKESEGKYITKKDFMKYYKKFCKSNKVSIVGDKMIKHILSSNFGVIDERTMINGKQEYIWPDIEIKDEKSICYGCYGFPTYRKKVKIDIGVNTLATLASSKYSCFTPTKTSSKPVIIDKNIKKKSENITKNKEKTPPRCYFCGSHEIFTTYTDDNGMKGYLCKKCDKDKFKNIKNR